MSSPPRPLTVSVSMAAFGAGDRRPAPRSPVTSDRRAPLPATVIVSAPAVPLTMTVSAAPSPAAAGRRRQVEVDLGDVGAGQVVDRDGVGAAQGVEVDVLDAVEVHGDVARRRG